MSFGADVGTGGGAATGFGARAEGAASARRVPPGSVPAEGDGTDRAALSGGGDASDPFVVSGGALAAGATTAGAPIAALSGAVSPAGEAPAVSPDPTFATAVVAPAASAPPE